MATYANINLNRSSVVFLKSFYDMFFRQTKSNQKWKKVIGLKLCSIYENANSRTCLLKM